MGYVFPKNKDTYSQVPHSNCPDARNLIVPLKISKFSKQKIAVCQCIVEGLCYTYAM